MKTNMILPGVNRLALAVTTAGLMLVSVASVARGDQWDKRTILTVNEPIQVPNKVLPAGKYVMRLLDSPINRNIVQIYNADETQLETTILAIPNQRLQPRAMTVFTFWEATPGQPKALRAWFYPGDAYGQKFVYPKSAATQIPAISHQLVPTTEATHAAQMPSAEVTTTPETPAWVARKEIARIAPPPAPPAEPAPPTA